MSRVADAYRRRRRRARTRSTGGIDIRMVALALMLTVVCTVPLWLTGALAVQMREELAYSVTALGGAIAIFRVSGALFAAPLGRLSDRLGPMAAMRVAALVAATASSGIALFAHNWLGLVAWLAVGGMCNALGQTAANLALVRAVDQGRQGIAFGVKQSALPLGAMLAGLAVPAFALTVGWRWAYVAAAVLALVIVVAVPRGRAGRYKRPEGVVDAGRGRLSLLVLAVAVFFGMGAVGGLTTFIVEYSSSSGFSPGAAGLVLTLGSVLAIVTRLIAGAFADRRQGGHIRWVAGMLLAGSVGYLLIASGAPTLILLGAVVAFGLGWGFNGLFWFAIVRTNQAAPAKATGTVMPGGMLGGVVGPLAFGWAAETLSYQVAWTGTAGWALLGGILMLVGRSLSLADRRRREATA